MNTHTRSGTPRWWLTAGVFLMGLGALGLRLGGSSQILAGPTPILPTESSVLKDSILLDAAIAISPGEPLATRSAEGTPADVSLFTALPWRLETLLPQADAVLPAGTLTVETRTPGGHWVSHGSLRVQLGGRIEFPAGPNPPFEYRVTSLALDSQTFMIDDKGFVAESAAEVVLRIDSEPRVAVYSRSTGEEWHTVRIAEASRPAPGARPAFDSPGPESFEVGLRELRAPFPARALLDLDVPLVCADGGAWRAIPERVARSGGRVFLDSGYRVSIHVDASAAVPVGGVEELSLQLMEDEVGCWGSSSLSATLGKSATMDGRLEGDFHFSGVPVPILSAAAEARWFRETVPPRGQVETARGFGGLCREGDRVRVPLRLDAPEEIVEGYIEFADGELMEQVTAVALYAVGGAVHVDSLFSRTLPFGGGLEVAGDGLLRWECRRLRPGRYAMLLKPLGIYCSLEVQSTRSGLQTLAAEVPELVSVGVHLADTDGTILTGRRSVAVTAFVAGAGAERPTITRPLEVVGDELSSPKLTLRVPRGARCFVNISSANRSAQGEFLAEAGALHEFRLRPEMRWVTLRRTVTAGEAAAPMRWWQQNVYRWNERGEKEAIVYRTRALQGPPRRSAFTSWGLARGREPCSELEVAVPVGAGSLLVRGDFAGMGDEVIDVGAGVSEVVLSVR